MRYVFIGDQRGGHTLPACCADGAVGVAYDMGGDAIGARTGLRQRMGQPIPAQERAENLFAARKGCQGLVSGSRLRQRGS